MCLMIGLHGRLNHLDVDNVKQLGFLVPVEYDGQFILLIFGWYGLGRVWIEGLRTDSLYLFDSGIRVSQLLAALLLVTCTGLLIYFRVKRPKREMFFYIKEIKKKDK